MANSSRLGADRVCTQVVVGVRADGKKELVALADGHRESAESRAALLRDASQRGMRTPVLAVGDRALGIWAALGEVFPEAQEQRNSDTGPARLVHAVSATALEIIGYGRWEAGAEPVRLGGGSALAVSPSS